MASTAKNIGHADGTLRLRFTAAVFAGSFLLFMVQPMIARMALPRLGGAPAVWNSAMLVYQALLLGGYAYAHWLGRLPPRRQAQAHMAAFAVAALTLPIGLVSLHPSAGSNPLLWVPGLLLLSIGPLFFVISAQAPLLQRWFATAGGGDPYPLYAASNLGSFGGLISYPLLIEPLMPLSAQSWLWSAGYLTVALLVAWCTFALPREATPRGDTPSTPAPTWGSWGKWAFIAAVPSGLILSSTLLLTTDIMAMPLLWVVPLGAYLLSFTVAFGGNEKLVEAIARIAPISLLAAVAGAIFVSLPVLALLTVFALFAISVALHRRLFESRPDPRHLTSFYLALSVGGVAGGIFCALMAPLVFDWTYEHLLLLVAAAWLLRSTSPFARFASLWNGDRTSQRMTIAGIVLVSLVAAAEALGLIASAMATLGILAVGILAIGNRPLFTVSVVALMLTAGGSDRLAQSAKPGQMMRSFFGVYVVTDHESSRSIAHGTTLHGVQNRGSVERERMATTYYAPKSGVGLALASTERIFGPRARVGVVGLGAGTLACYRRPGQQWTMYEIDPLVARIATDSRRFTFLSRCLPDARIRLGDARVTLEQEPAGSADVLVIDAFSSDSIPVHLLTAEAFEVYRRHLSANGLLLIHISNKYLDLEPVLAAAAANGRWHAAGRFYRTSDEDIALNYTRSHWIAMSPSFATMQKLTGGSPEPWEPLSRGGIRWTDDHASLLSVIGR